MEQTKITVEKRAIIVDLRETLKLWETSIRIDLENSRQVFKSPELRVDAYRRDYLNTSKKLEALYDIHVITNEEYQTILCKFYEIYEEYNKKEVKEANEKRRKKQCSDRNI